MEARQAVSRQRKSIPAFAGLRTSVDPTGIPETNAQDLLNFDLEQGILTSRYGYRVVRSPQASFSAGYGCHYAQGYNSSYALVEEYVTFENLGAGVNAYSRNVTTGAPTAITNATGLTASDWRGVNWDRWAYFINDTDNVKRYVLGDTATGWGTPASLSAPASAPTYEIHYQTTAGLPYAEMDYAGINVSTEMTYTGSAIAGALNADNTLTVSHSTSGSMVCSFTIDLNGSTAGKPDWTYNDAFSFRLASTSPKFLRIDKASVRVTFTSNGGTAFVPSVQYAVEFVDGQVDVFCRYDNKTRASWSSIRYMKVEYQLRTRSTISATLNNVIVSKLVQGCCFPALPWSPDDHWKISYAYYNSTTLEESGLCPALDLTGADLFRLQGTNPYTTPDGLGVWVNIKSLAATGSADKSRVYFAKDDGWYRVVEQDDTTATYMIKASYAELTAGTLYYPSPYSLTGVRAACPFKGWMVWFTKGGNTNIKHSRVGDPEKLADLNNQLPDGDGNRAATFSLADNFGDEPLGGVQADDVLLIAGNQGVYAQIGDTPSGMTPPKKLPGSFPVAGYYAFTRWQDNGGQAGMVYLSTNGQVYFIAANAGVDNPPTVVELTAAVRPTAASFLMAGQSLTSFSTARVQVDPWRDALWVVMGARAMVLRRESPVTGDREWELYSFNLTGSVTIKYLAFSPRQRMRAFLSDGNFIEFEWNSNSGAWITGANRDGGNAMTSPYWQSKTFDGPNRRYDFIGVQRDTGTNTPSVTVAASRASQSVTLVSGQTNARLGPQVQGRRVSFKVTGGENYDPMRELYYAERPAAERFAE